ncbi:MAG: 16S rRNA (guanine(527)-N(7))-methyltransferase RsmG [Thiohalomonadaceae bacterium]
MSDDRTRLAAGARALGLELDASALDRLLAYRDLLAKWNRAYNLTAVRDPAEMIEKHLLDSLSVAPYLHGDRICDVGTGGGLPGVPLAIVQPGRRFTLLDSNGKKTRFLVQAAAELGLQNVTVVHARAEQHRPAERCTTVVTRAFATLADMLAASGHLLAPGGVFLAMKGVYPREELAAVPPTYRVQDVLELHVPGLEGARHLVRIAPAGQEG